MTRALLIALAALAASCSPPAQQAAETPETPAAITEGGREEVLAALTTAVSATVAQPVSLNATTVSIDNDWAYVVAQPRKADGSAMDWSTTTLATQASEGMLDGDGTTYALLKRENGQWRVLEHAIGPTDVPWLEWPVRHGAPATLIPN